MRKLFLIFTTVIFSVVCLSVSAFATDACTHSNLRILMSVDCTEHVGHECPDCGFSERITPIRHTGSSCCTDYESIYGLDFAYHHLCSVDGSWQMSCPHFMIIGDFEIFADDCVVSYITSDSCHAFYCLSCKVEFHPLLAQFFYIPHTNFTSCEFCMQLFPYTDFRVLSEDGTLSSFCDCGWLDAAAFERGEISACRFNGKHEFYCPDCEAPYYGCFSEFMGSDMYACLGTDCPICLNFGITEDLIYPSSDSKTLTDYVTDTGSILSSGLDMASTTARTVTENPVLLLLYAIPFTAIAVIVYRKVKR